MAGRVIPGRTTERFCPLPARPFPHPPVAQDCGVRANCVRRATIVRRPSSANIQETTDNLRRASADLVVIWSVQA